MPAVITGALWALPGDPAELICPPEICTGTARLAERFHLDQGPVEFYRWWLSGAVSGDFGASWRMMQGVPVGEEVWRSLPYTLALVTLAALMLVGATLLGGVRRIPRAVDAVWQAMGLAPVVLGALLAAAWIEITYGARSHDGLPGVLRVVLGAGVLAMTDGLFSATVSSTRKSLEAEAQRRYALFAVLRGESVLANTLPNVLPALAGQLRGRLTHVLSSAVIVEVVLGIQGLGDLLWRGTLSQDFSVVLASAWVFAWLASALLIAQAAVELLVGHHVQSSPEVPQ